jgi:phosphatidylglycerol lysyltransferase
LPATIPLPHEGFWLIGVLLLALVAAYVAFAVRAHGKAVRIKGYEFRLPSLPGAAMQLGVAAADWLSVAGVLYVLLPSEAVGSYPSFLAIFLLSQLVGLVSQVPGGLGVFEGSLLLLLHGGTTGGIVAALLAYRLIYYFFPLCIATVTLGGYEGLRQRKRLDAFGRMFSRWAAPVAPHVFALASVVAGALLLVSGATPAVEERLRWLSWLLPLPLLEASHLLGSLVGVGLLFLARGLSRRLNGAWALAVALLAAGAAVSLLKGLDYEEAAILTLMLLALLPCRSFFYRRSSLLDQRFTPQWILTVVLVLAGIGWVVLVAYRHVEYSHDLWWNFALDADVSRSLRATTAAAALAAVLGLFRLLRSAPALPNTPATADLDRAEAIVLGWPDTSANLALLGDKCFLFNEAGTAFLMYATRGHTWVCLGGPVGPKAERAELAWRFRELSDLYGGWPLFYEVPSEDLPLYLDMGSTLLKLGEDARVPLGDFSLSGVNRKALRGSVNRVQRLGCRLEIVPKEGVPAILQELHQVSDDWLATKRTREKGFSLGFFQEGYLQRYPCAVVRLEGRIVAFANLWLGAGKEELSVDLMRHSSLAPHGIMDFLFAELMLWGREQGYRWFNLGMAPLSGLEDRTLAPFWNRAGAFVFRHGEDFYNFQGVREYKAKFDPVWEPRYLAAPGGITLPMALLDLAALISGGVKGIVSK